MRFHNKKIVCSSVLALLMSATCCFSYAQTEGANYSHNQTLDLDLRNQALSGANFTWSQLKKAKFTGSNLSRADFSNAQLIDCDMKDADLREANFYNAQLINCNLQGAQVAGTNFEGAIFSRSKVGGIDFSQARMNWSDMRNADFTLPGAMASTLLSEGEINLSINFDYNKDTLRDDAMEPLRELANSLNAPELVSVPIRIEGHTDGDGSAEYNMDLSKRRALRVKSVLASKFGVALNRMSTEGLGESEPIASNATDTGKQQNRRVTIVNLAFGKQP